jgi:hypothetical protein
MTTALLVRTVALGAITGARSMSGLAAVTRRGGSRLAPLAVMLWLGETLADKSPAIGNRTELLPLTGRAVLGGVVGGMAAREAGASRVGGVLLGAGTAVVAAHLAMRARQRLPLPPVAAGLVEDAVVGAIAACCAGRHTVGNARDTMGKTSRRR